MRFALVCKLAKPGLRPPPLAVALALHREVGPLALPWSFLLPHQDRTILVRCTTQCVMVPMLRGPTLWVAMHLVVIPSITGSRQRLVEAPAPPLAGLQGDQVDPLALALALLLAGPQTALPNHLGPVFPRNRLGEMTRIMRRRWRAQ